MLLYCSLTPDHHEAIGSCSENQFFTFDCNDACENIQSLGTQLTINHFSISKLKYKHLNSLSQLLLLLLGDIHQGTRPSLNEWNVFKNRGLHFIHLNINSLLSKIEDRRFTIKCSNAVVIGICDS